LRRALAAGLLLLAGCGGVVATDNGANAEEGLTTPVWQKIPGGLKQVSVGSDGTVMGVNSANQIWKYMGGYWKQLPGALTQISVLDVASPVRQLFRHQVVFLGTPRSSTILEAGA
jgi:hypothetical protein